jgi:hypothetical protein
MSSGDFHPKKMGRYPLALCQAWLGRPHPLALSGRVQRQHRGQKRHFVVQLPVVEFRLSGPAGHAGIDHFDTVVTFKF